MRALFTFLAYSLSLFLATNTWATSVLVDDNHISWPGYTNAVNNSYGDVIGIPDITQLQFDFTGHNLNSVTAMFDLSGRGELAAWNADRLKPGDIFIDQERDGYWDYVIHNPTNLVRTTATYNTIKNADVSDAWLVYNTHLAYGGKNTSNPNNYNLSTVFEPNTQNWIWRYNHPIQAKDTQLLSSTGLTAGVDWPDTANSTAIKASWTFLDGSLDLSGYNNITVGFALSCANDVFIEDVRIPNPEPTSMTLLGIGIVATGLLRRRIKFRS